jgi:transcriptional regulator with XRE-family HTH domain
MAERGQMDEHPLRAYRHREKLSADSIAAATGINRSTITRIETGKIQPSLDTIGKLIGFAGGALSADSFLGAQMTHPPLRVAIDEKQFRRLVAGEAVCTRSTAGIRVQFILNRGGMASPEVPEFLPRCRSRG